MNRISFSSRAWRAALAGAALVAGPALSVERPLVPVFDAATISARCDRELANVRGTLKAMESRKGAGKVFAELNALSIAFTDFAYPVYLLQNVSPDKATRDAAQACLEKVLPFETEIYQSEALYKRVKAVKPADLTDQVYQQDLIEKFEDGAAALPPDKRKRAKEINDEIERMSLQFSKNVNEDPTKVVLTPAEAAGLPESWLAARKRDAEGNLVLGLDYPTVVPFLTLATSEEARRKVWLAKQREGGMPNIDTPRSRAEAAQGTRGSARRAGFRDLHAQAPHGADAGRRLRVSRQGEGRRRQRRGARPRRTAGGEGRHGRQAGRGGEAQPLGRRVPAGADQEGALQDRPGSAARVLPHGQEPAVHHEARRAAVRGASSPSARSGRGTRTCATSTSTTARATDRAARSSAASTWTSIPREGKYNHAAAFRCAAGLDARASHAGLGAGDELQPQGTGPRRARDAAARVRPRAARRAVEDALRRPGRHVGEARLRRGAVADVRGVGAPRGAARAVRADLPRVPAPDERADRAAGRRPPVRPRHLLRPAVGVRAATT